MIRRASLFLLVTPLVASFVALPAQAQEPPRETSIPPAQVASLGETPIPPAQPVTMGETPMPPAQPVAPALRPAPFVAPYAFAPPWWSLPPQPTERHSKAMMATGIAFFGASGIVTTLGLGLLGIAEGQSCEIPEVTPLPPEPHRRPRARGGSGHDGGRPHTPGEPIGTARQAFDLCGEDSKVSVALGVLAAGVLLGGVGIPLFVFGNSKARDKHGNDGALVPALRVGTGSAELRWSF